MASNPSPISSSRENQKPVCKVILANSIARPFLEETRAALTAKSSNSEDQPKLVGFLATDDEGSRIYAEYTAKTCEEYGFSYELRRVDPEDVEAEIIKANGDSGVNGIMVYYPIFGQETRRDQYLQSVVCPEKDVEGLCHQYLFNMYQNIRFLDAPKNEIKSILPCTPLAIIKVLEHVQVYNSKLEYGNRLYGKTITVINRSEVVGRPLAALLANDGAIVYSVDINGIQIFSRGEGIREPKHNCHHTTLELANVLPISDVVISGVPSKAYKVPLQHLKAGAICINFANDKNFAPEVKEKASIYVPAIGKVTIAILLRNICRLIQIQSNQQLYYAYEDNSRTYPVDVSPPRYQNGILTPPRSVVSEIVSSAEDLKVQSTAFVDSFVYPEVPEFDQVMSTPYFWRKQQLSDGKYNVASGNLANTSAAEMKSDSSSNAWDSKMRTLVSEGFDAHNFGDNFRHNSVYKGSNANFVENGGHKGDTGFDQVPRFCNIPSIQFSEYEDTRDEMTIQRDRLYGSNKSRLRYETPYLLPYTLGVSDDRVKIYNVNGLRFCTVSDSRHVYPADYQKPNFTSGGAGGSGHWFREEFVVIPYTKPVRRKSTTKTNKDPESLMGQIRNVIPVFKAKGDVVGTIEHICRTLGSDLNTPFKVNYQHQQKEFYRLLDLFAHCSNSTPLPATPDSLASTYLHSPDFDLATQGRSMSESPSNSAVRSKSRFMKQVNRATNESAKSAAIMSSNFITKNDSTMHAMLKETLKYESKSSPLFVAKVSQSLKRPAVRGHRSDSGKSFSDGLSYSNFSDEGSDNTVAAEAYRPRKARRIDLEHTFSADPFFD